MEKKPGWKTTEFWLTLIANIVGLLLASGAITNDMVLQGLGMASMALGNLGYGMARASTKRSENALAAVNANPTSPQP
jgi:hypothetical protein